MIGIFKSKRAEGNRAMVRTSLAATHADAVTSALAVILSACSFDLPTDTVDTVADYALLQTLPEPGPRPASFECTLGDVTVWGDEEHVTTFHAEGFEPVTVRSEDEITDVHMSGVLVIVVGDLFVVGDQWVRLGECE